VSSYIYVYLQEGYIGQWNSSVQKIRDGEIMRGTEECTSLFETLLSELDIMMNENLTDLLTCTEDVSFGLKLVPLTFIELNITPNVIDLQQTCRKPITKPLQDQACDDVVSTEPESKSEVTTESDSGINRQQSLDSSIQQSNPISSTVEPDFANANGTSDKIETFRSSLSEDEKEIFKTVERCRKIISEEKMEDIIGQEDAKRALAEAIVWPSKIPNFFTVTRPPAQAVLLYGPPGTAKTKMVNSFAGMSSATLFEVQGSDVKSKWIGQSDKFVKFLFLRANMEKFSIIFIDEIDHLLPSRIETDVAGCSGITNQFLVELNGKYNPERNRVVLIGATNFPNRIDAAISRRFQKIVRLQMPSVMEREIMFRNCLSTELNNLTDFNFKQLAERSDG
jgi:SpoVK/Ycf46/Vps4 family AAA+-type ATPase